MTTSTTIGIVAHYNLLERLEPAGPGDLYRARDTHHGRTVIVRVLPVSAAAAEGRTLLDQAQTLARLSHQNAITVFSAGEHEGRVYVAFERVTGRSLRAEMSGRPMNARRAAEVAIQIADAVAEAHALGFVHSGLSPDAIGMTAKGHAKIPAFHLATTMGFEGVGDEARLADYVSPEEARGELPDERSDVYSIGAVLYEMLAARRPMHRGASAPSTSNPQVPIELDNLVLKAAAPSAERRFHSAAELAAALRGVMPLLELPEMPSGIVVDEREGPSVGKIVVLALVMLGTLAAVAWWLMRS